ncbi:MAG: hypothetical protein ACRDWY_09965 [Actinomycetes bacterium]
MQLIRSLRLTAAVAAAAVSITVLGAAPALAAPKPRATVALTSSPASPSQVRTATFTWTGVAGATFTCSLDGATAASCASPMSYSGLGDGTHRFSVRSKATGYRPGGTSFTWQVDGTPPAAPTIAPVPSPTSSDSASISFSNTDPSAVSHTCSVDGAAASACISPLSVPGPLADGTHTVIVTAQDVWGFSGPSALVSWVVDQTAPGNVTITAPPSPTNQTSFSVPFSEPDAASFTCSLDNGPAAACASPYVIAGPVAEGPHSLTVTATDGAGNVGQPATAVWVVDVTAPARPTIVTGPAAQTNQTTADFRLGDIDSSGSLLCSLDGASWAACPQPLSYSALAAVAHDFRVRVEDAAGNTSAAASHAWTVDTLAPAPPAITDGPLSPSNDTTPSFDFVETDPSMAAFQCALDGAAYTTCDGTEAPVVTGDGLHVYAVRATDGATNVSSPVIWSWTLDTTAPAAPVFSNKPAASTTETTALFSFSSEAGVTFRCSVDDGAPISCASPLTLTGLSLGAHSLVVLAQDAAQNTSQTRHDWTVGATTPTTPPTPPAPPAPPALPTPPAPPAGGPVATTATVTASSALRGVSTVAFSDTVRGVPASVVQLRATGSTGTVAVALSCADAAGTTVDCAGNGVRKAYVKPRLALVPGQRYTLSLTGGVVDAAGTAVAPASAAFRASVREQESSLRAGYLWRTAKTASAYGRSYLVEQRAKAAVIVPFTGKRVTWYTMTGPSQGVAFVYVDGVRKAKVNNYSPTNKSRVARTLKGLGAGRHELRIVVAGVKGSRSATGTSVVLDAVRVGTTLRKSPVATASWRQASAKAASGSRYAIADLTGASTSFTFRGTAVSWFTQTSPAMGKAKVYVDGVLKGTVDNYSKRAKWNVRRAVTGLSDATHTVKVVVAGAKRRASKGTSVVVDRWSVS